MSNVKGTKACREAKVTIKISRDTAVSWKRVSDQGGQSVIGYLQHCSDKSQISLSAQLYFLNASLLKFSENARCNHILSATTIVAYLLVSLKHDGQGCEYSSPQQSGEGKIRRRFKSIEAVHQSITTILLLLTDVSMRCFACTLLNENHDNVHILLTFYIADLPKTEGLLDINRVSRTK